MKLEARTFKICKTKKRWDTYRPKSSEIESIDKCHSFAPASQRHECISRLRYHQSSFVKHGTTKCNMKWLDLDCTCLYRALHCFNTFKSNCVHIPIKDGILVEQYSLSDTLPMDTTQQTPRDTKFLWHKTWYKCQYNATNLDWSSIMVAAAYKEPLRMKQK